MAKILSYTFIVVGIVGFIFFMNYNGTAIPLKELWFVLSLFVGIYGGYLFLKNKYKNYHTAQVADSSYKKIMYLKEKGEKIKVTLDNCEIKTRSYYQENLNAGIPSKAEMLDGLYDDNQNYSAEEIQQTYIVYYKKYGDINYKFISQP